MNGDALSTTGNRPTLSPRAVIQEALALAHADGLEAVSIRKLAGRLGVTPMALYWHVRSKDDLLDGMAAGLFEQFDLEVDPSASWRDQLRRLLASMVATLRRHPAAATLVSTRTVTSASGLRATELMLDILRRGGFSPVEATQVARHALSTVTNLAGGEPGVVLRNESGEQADTRHAARHVLEALPPEHYPRMVEAADPLSEGVDPDTYVTFGLELLLAGIEAMAARRG